MFCEISDDICENLAVNDELRYGPKRGDDPESALAGSMTEWCGSNGGAWWAVSTNLCCGIYSVEFEARNVTQVEVSVRFWGSYGSRRFNIQVCSLSCFLKNLGLCETKMLYF